MLVRRRERVNACWRDSAISGSFRYGSVMGQMGENQRATPDVAALVKRWPSASSAPYEVAPPLPRESVAGKPWKEAGRSHLATAVRVEGSSSTVVRILGMNRSPQASRLRERAKAARRTARAVAPLTGQGSVTGDRSLTRHQLALHLGVLRFRDVMPCCFLFHL